MSSAPQLSSLLDHASWLHGVAHAMVRDPALAEDLAQDALEAGLRNPGKEVRDPRRWLAGALRNLHRQELKKRKLRREQQATPGGEAAAKEQRRGHLEIQKIVAEAVLQLPVEQRDVLVLRFYEERTIRAIGAELGIGRTAVSHRLTQAQRALRTALRERLGPQWAMLFLPLALPRSLISAASLTLGGTGAAAGGAIFLAILLGVAAILNDWAPGYDSLAAGADAALMDDGRSLATPGSGTVAEVLRTPHGSSSSAPLDLEGFEDEVEGAAASAESAAAPSVGEEAEVIGGAWTRIPTSTGKNAHDSHGDTLANVGDQDGDGYDEYLIAAVNVDHEMVDEEGKPGVWLNAGSVYLHDGFTGKILKQWDGGETSIYLGDALAGLGDVDGDRTPDFAIGAPGATVDGKEWAGRLTVYSGKAPYPELYVLTGEQEWNGMGWAVAGADLDRDGHADILVGVCGYKVEGVDQSGKVQVYSGKDGKLLYEVLGTKVHGWFGRDLQVLDDVSGDGIADFIVIERQEFYSDLDSGVFFLHSGADGEELDVFECPLPYSTPRAIADLGDLDGDGRSEFALGAPGNAILIPPGEPMVPLWRGTRASKGNLWICTFRDGFIDDLEHFEGEEQGLFLGGAVTSVGDLNGDHVPDFAYSSYGHAEDDPEGNGVVTVRSGSIEKGFPVLWRIAGPTPFEEYGNFFARKLTCPGDLDGDGLAELLIGSPNADVGAAEQAGRASVHAFHSFLTLSRESLRAGGGEEIEFRLDFPASEAGLPYAVLMSPTGAGPSLFAGRPIPLTEDLRLELFAASGVPHLENALGELDEAGQATAVLLAGPGLQHYLGQELWFAAVTFDRDPLTARRTSVARRLEIRP